jgi:hypothetical protein
MNMLQFPCKSNNLCNQSTVSHRNLLPYTLSLLIILALFSGRPAWAEDVGIYGPVQFTRSTGKPVQVQQTIAVINPAVSYRLHIVNGGLQGTTKTGSYVSSGTIYWNGSLVASASNFNQQITALTLPVTAHLSNTLTVELQGKPGTRSPCRYRSNPLRWRRGNARRQRFDRRRWRRFKLPLANHRSARK